MNREKVCNVAFDKEKTLAAAQKYADKDQHEKAIREFQKILDVEPNDLRVLLLIASSYERVGKMDEASNAYVKIFEQYFAIKGRIRRHLPSSSKRNIAIPIPTISP